MKKSAFILLSHCFGILLVAAQDLAWSKRMGNTGNDEAYSIAVDATGNAHTTGAFTGTVDFDPGAGIVNLASSGGFDVFVQKLDVDGNFIWARKIGGTSGDYGYSITVDGSGNVYVGGIFQNTVDFDPGAGTFNLTSAGSWDCFVLKLDVNGNFVWAVRFGAAGHDQLNSLSLNSTGEVVCTGYFRNTVDFDPGAGTFNLSSAGSEDIFILKLSSAGVFQWAKRIGGNSTEEGLSVAVDNNDNIGIAGYYYGTVDFDPNAGVVNRTSNGDADIFALKLTNAGNFVWCHSIGGSDFDWAGGVDFDLNNNMFLTGSFREVTDFDPGPGVQLLTSAGEDDIFILKLTETGLFDWVKQIGGAGEEWGNAIRICPLGSVYAVGQYSTNGNVDFNPNVGVFNLANAGGFDGFNVKLDNYGNFVWAYRIASNQSDIVYSVDCKDPGYVYCAGTFRNTANFNPTGLANMASAGNSDAFVQKITETVLLNTEAILLDGISQSESNLIFWGNTYNSAPYFIEKSTDGHSWHILEEVTPQFSESALYYNDYNINHSIVYYRVKQTNLKSEIIVSNTIALEASLSDFVQIYPNPTRNDFIKINGLSHGVFEIYHTTGKTIQKGAFENNQIENLNLTPGVYLLKLSDETSNKQNTIRLIKL